MAQEHTNQEAERELRAAFYEDIKAGKLSITEAVATMRRISRLSPADFARHRGIDVDTLEQIESGAVEPMIANLNQIAAIFGLEVRFVRPCKLCSASTSNPVEILQQAHEACRALAPYRAMSLDDFKALGYDGTDQVAELATNVSYSADDIASILTDPDLDERDRLRRLATLSGDRDLGGGLTARCLHHYVTQQVPELEQVLRDALERAAAGSPC